MRRKKNNRFPFFKLLKIAQWVAGPTGICSTISRVNLSLFALSKLFRQQIPYYIRTGKVISYLLSFSARANPKSDPFDFIVNKSMNGFGLTIQTFHLTSKLVFLAFVTDL